MSEEPMFNLLVRHKEGRTEMLERCFASINKQIYKNYLIIQSSEPLRDFEFGTHFKRIFVPKQHYNLHCNDLKRQVEHGWIIYLDDDDALAAPNVLQDLSNIIVNNYPWKGAYIGRFLRNGLPKPPMDHIRKGIIQKGFIGGGCCVLHHSFKDVADWQGVPAGDYLWLKELQERAVPMKFIDLVLQKTFNNGLHGR